MAIGIGIGLSPSFGGGGGPIPPTQSINWGAKTRTGHGAHLLSYTGSGTLSITSQKDAGNADVTIWQISQNALSWKGASATYGTAAPASLNGPYTVIVTDGPNTSTVTINILSNALHVREMAAVAQGGRWATDAMYTVDGTGSSGVHQLRTLCAGAILTRGDTIWCRDGMLDPTSSGLRVRPEVSYSGSGLITIRSETVDDSVDAYGLKNRKHGFRIGFLGWDSAVSGAVYFPFEVRDVWFQANAAGATKCMSYSAAGWGVNHVNCRFEASSVVSSPSTCDGVVVRGSQTDPVDCSYNTFTNLGRAIDVTFQSGGSRTKGATVRWNEGSLLLEDFISDSSEGTVVEYNFCRDFVTGGAGAHRDFYQHSGFADPLVADGPKIRYNVCVNNVGVATFTSQLFFLDDSTGAARLTNVEIENNLGFTQYANGIYLNRTTNPDIRFNTALSVVGGNIGVQSPTSVAVTVPAGKAGSDGTFTYNVSNTFDVSNQTGTVVSTPNDQIASLTTGAYLTAMPGYVNTGIYTRAQAIAAYAPANLAVASGGFKETDDRFNGALFPDGSWNDGAAYVNGRLPVAT